MTDTLSKEAFEYVVRMRKFQPQAVIDDLLGHIKGLEWRIKHNNTTAREKQLADALWRIKKQAQGSNNVIERNKEIIRIVYQALNLSGVPEWELSGDWRTGKLNYKEPTDAE